MQIDNDDILNNDDDDDDDINDEDLDAFLVLLESRLRADFTSPDLSRIISSQGAPSNSSTSSSSSSSLLSTLPSGNASSPSKFLRLIHLVFSKAGKSIKLRSLMSVLGLDDDATVESSQQRNANSTSLYAASAAANNNHALEGEDELIKGRKTDAIVYKLLTQAENDDEKWVRVVAGIIKRLMFISNHNNSSSNNNETTTTNENNKKETESEKQLRKITTNILSAIEKTYMAANDKFNETKTQIINKIHIESTDDIEVQQKLSKFDDTNIKSTYLIGLDSYPTYTPLYYTLVSSPLIKDIIPQLNDTNNNPHFTSNMDADILKVDGEVERKRAEEEGKEIRNGNMKKSSSLLPSTNNGSAGGTSSNVGGRGRGNSNNNITNSNAAGRGGPILAGRITSTRRGVGRGGGGSGGASLFRPSSTLGRVGGGVAAGRAPGRGGGGRLGGGGGRATGGGRSGSLSRLVAAGGRGTGGGRVGSISAPLQRRVPGAARSAILNSSSSGRGSVSSAGRGGRGGGGGSGGGGAGETKMKMIDASEVEGLTRAAAEREKTSNLSTVEARKLERKRKLMESAAASGLRNREKKKIASSDGGGTTAAATPSGGNNDQAVSAATAAISQNESDNTGILGEQPQIHQQQQQQQQQQHSAASITSLLEKSNKLSPEDRQTIFQFFQNRNNNQGSMSQPAPPPGTDESGIWRVKLNEDKAFDESTGEVVKETLYLELDYKSLGYKKTRKIKRK